MNIHKLFGVLVVGGSLLTAGCTETDPEPADAATAQAGAKDGGDTAGPDAIPGTPDAAEGELESCGFCPNECCEYDEDGNGAPMEGFECCWGTAC